MWRRWPRLLGGKVAGRRASWGGGGRGGGAAVARDTGQRARGDDGSALPSVREDAENATDEERGAPERPGWGAGAEEEDEALAAARARAFAGRPFEGRILLRLFKRRLRRARRPMPMPIYLREAHFSRAEVGGARPLVYAARAGREEKREVERGGGREALRSCNNNFARAQPPPPLSRATHRASNRARVGPYPAAPFVRGRARAAKAHSLAPPLRSNRRLSVARGIAGAFAKALFAAVCRARPFLRRRAGVTIY
jgi:hypothetical protein